MTLGTVEHLFCTDNLGLSSEEMSQIHHGKWSHLIYLWHVIVNRPVFIWWKNNLLTQRKFHKTFCYLKLLKYNQYLLPNSAFSSIVTYLKIYIKSPKSPFLHISLAKLEVRSPATSYCEYLSFMLILSFLLPCVITQSFVSRASVTSLYSG